MNELGKSMYTYVNTWPAASWLPMIDEKIASTPLGVVATLFGDLDTLLNQSPFGVATTKFLLSLFVVYPFAVLLRNIKSKDGSSNLIVLIFSLTKNINRQEFFLLVRWNIFNEMDLRSSMDSLVDIFIVHVYDMYDRT